MLAGCNNPAQINGKKDNSQLNESLINLKSIKIIELSPYSFIENSVFEKNNDLNPSFENSVAKLKDSINLTEEKTLVNWLQMDSKVIVFTAGASRCFDLRKNEIEWENYSGEYMVDVYTKYLICSDLFYDLYFINLKNGLTEYFIKYKSELNEISNYKELNNFIGFSEKRNLLILGIGDFKVSYDGYRESGELGLFDINKQCFIKTLIIPTILSKYRWTIVTEDYLFFFDELQNMYCYSLDSLEIIFHFKLPYKFSNNEIKLYKPKLIYSSSQYLIFSISNKIFCLNIKDRIFDDYLELPKLEIEKKIYSDSKKVYLYCSKTDYSEYNNPCILKLDFSTGESPLLIKLKPPYGRENIEMYNTLIIYFENKLALVGKDLILYDAP
jgi:hypothetical protein